MLTRSLESGHVIDFQPYTQKTDALLFTYEELHTLAGSSSGDSATLPDMRVVDDNTHPSHSVPSNIHNMVPLEFLSLSAGQTLDEFQKVWQEEIRQAAEE